MGHWGILSSLWKVEVLFLLVFPSLSVSEWVFYLMTEIITYLDTLIVFLLDVIPSGKLEEGKTASVFLQ